jgi:hypothetical protein
MKKDCATFTFVGKAGYYRMNASKAKQQSNKEFEDQSLFNLHGKVFRKTT